tara:strand:+ start:471 stop:674 length:204 start_codon:yes stop_codon:yes gene_type:complete
LFNSRKTNQTAHPLQTNRKANVLGSTFEEELKNWLNAVSKMFVPEIEMAMRPFGQRDARPAWIQDGG